MAAFPQSSPRLQGPRKHWDLDFDQVCFLVITEGTDDDVLLFETLLEVYYEQWRDPDKWHDADIELEAARRLGKKPNTFYKQLERMRKRTQHNAALRLTA